MVESVLGNGFGITENDQTCIKKRTTTDIVLGRQMKTLKMAGLFTFAEWGYGLRRSGSVLLTQLSLCCKFA